MSYAHRTVFDRTVAREMLGDRHDAVGSELLALKAFHEGLNQGGVQIGVFAESAADAVPSRLVVVSAMGPSNTRIPRARSS